MIILACAWTSLALATLGADAQIAPGVSITVYSSADPASFDPQRFIGQARNGQMLDWAWQVPGYGIVKEVRPFSLQPGANTVSLTDVAQFIDPTTVSFLDLTDPATAILEQRFEFDLVSPEKLMEKYIDRWILVRPQDQPKAEPTQGTLLSASGGMLVLMSDSALRLLPIQGNDVEFPGGNTMGLITRPTLSWSLEAATGGTHLVRTAYQTKGMTWRADYNMVLDASNTHIDLTAWVTLMNLSGSAFSDAQLKLVAGDVHRVQPEPTMLMAVPDAGPMPRSLGLRAAGFEEKAFFEYHLYTLPRRIDVPQSATQQITLFPAISQAPVEKQLIVEPVRGGQRWGSDPYLQRDSPSGMVKPEVFIVFRNDEKSKLGMPLPAGKVRVFQTDDADGSLEFIGEDLIDHTPRNEELRIKLGESFDVVAERTPKDFHVDSGRKTMEETVSIEVRNQKRTAQKVTVRERMLRWMTWNMVKESVAGTKTNSTTQEWTLDLPPEGKQVIEYTVRYTW